MLLVIYRRRQGQNPRPSPSTKEDWLKSKTRLASWLWLNGQLYMQHHRALGWLKQMDFSVSARSLPCRALNLRILLFRIPNFQLTSHLHKKICQSSVSILYLGNFLSGVLSWDVNQPNLPLQSRFLQSWLLWSKGLLINLWSSSDEILPPQLITFSLTKQVGL